MAQCGFLGGSRCDPGRQDPLANRRDRLREHFSISMMGAPGIGIELSDAYIRDHRIDPNHWGKPALDGRMRMR